MPFSGGVFSRVYNWVTDRNNTVPITASRMDQEFDGIATGLSNCVLKDGTQTITADIPFNSKKITGLGNATASTDAMNLSVFNTRLTGVVLPFAGSTAPTGWILCYGQAVSRTTYAALFAIISTTYGTGDGSTTFNLPDLRGRTPFGKDDMGGSAASRITNAVSGITGTTLGAAGGSQLLHAHTHTVTDPGHAHLINWSTANQPGQPITGIISSSGQMAAAGTNTQSATTGISIQNGGTGASQNMPPAVILNFIIYAAA